MMRQRISFFLCSLLVSGLLSGAVPPANAMPQPPSGDSNPTPRAPALMPRIVLLAPFTLERAKQHSTGKESEPDTLAIPARHRLAETTFANALAHALPQRFQVSIVTPQARDNALQDLHLSLAQIGLSKNARELCAHLHADILLVPQMTYIEIREGRTRDISLWGKVAIWTDAAAPVFLTPKMLRHKHPSRALSHPLPDVIPFYGSASTGHRPFHIQYGKSQPVLLREAAYRAAAVTTHVLQSGEVPPFSHPEENLAVTPIFAPPLADKLLFTPQGRRVLSAAVQAPGEDISIPFAPDLLPLAPSAILSPDKTRYALQKLGLTVGALWAREGLPDQARVQKLGQKMGVDYLLSARITDIEIDEGLPDTADTLHEARAEAMGALVRVADGTILWQERTTAALTHHDKPGQPLATDTQLVHSAERFALIQLQRRFRAYRLHFEQ